MKIVSRCLLMNPIIVAYLCTWLVYPDVAKSCTTAVWAADATANHTPLMWKNRDTDGAYNGVTFVDRDRYRYVGLGDSGDRASRGVFAGLNEVGFAIFNTVAYNLPQSDLESKDREGEIMAEVLGSVGTVAEFETYLASHLGPDLGAQTNFVVGDVSGALWVFETHNHGYEKYPVHSSVERSRVITNFSLSGAVNEGTGYMRYDRAKSIIDDHDGPVDISFVLRSLARDFTNALLSTPSLNDLYASSGASPRYYPTVDTINRGSTVSVAVIEGKDARNSASLATFWVLIGEPLTGLAVPLWVEAGAVPQVLSVGSPTAMQRASQGLKASLRPLHYPEQDKYINLSRLANSEGTGILRPLNDTQDVIVNRTHQFLAVPRSSGELRSFQDEIAAYAIGQLRGLTADERQPFTI